MHQYYEYAPTIFRWFFGRGRTSTDISKFKLIKMY